MLIFLILFLLHVQLCCRDRKVLFAFAAAHRVF
jgi:hypothetical protein